jgi:hypothetical protein
MSEKGREAYNAYHREWRKKNKEKVAIYNKNYWDRKIKEENNTSN